MDEGSSARPFALLGAIEDSLVLSLSSDPGLRKEGAFDGPVLPPGKKRKAPKVAAGDVARFEELPTRCSPPRSTRSARSPRPSSSAAT